MDSLDDRLRRRARLDVVGVGEASLDQVWQLPAFPTAGGKLRATACFTLGGGQVATAMVACRRLGLRAAFAGAVGDDAAGETILAGLAEEGVDVSGVRHVRGGVSHQAAILVDERGERTVLWHERLTVAGQVDCDLVAEARVLLVDGTDLAASTMAARAAREVGVVVVCDLESFRPEMAELLGLIDVGIFSAGFLVEATGVADPRQALPTLADRGPAVSCVTLGERGCLAVAERRLSEQSALALPRLVDTTACGDTFRAGFIAAMLEGQDLGGCLRLATVAAGLKTRDYGRRGCPTRAEVDAVMATGGYGCS